MNCIDCLYYKVNICRLKHCKVNNKSIACLKFTQQQNTITKDKKNDCCKNCKFSYYPDKSYRNYYSYINYRGEYFLCKCKHEKYANFLYECCNKFQPKT